MLKRKLTVTDINNFNSQNNDILRPDKQLLINNNMFDNMTSIRDLIELRKSKRNIQNMNHPDNMSS